MDLGKSERLCAGCPAPQPGAGQKWTDLGPDRPRLGEAPFLSWPGSRCPREAHPTAVAQGWVPGSLHLVRPRESLRDLVTSTLIRACDKGKQGHHHPSPVLQMARLLSSPTDPAPSDSGAGQQCPDVVQECRAQRGREEVD